MIIWKPRQQADEINIPKTKNNKKHANQLDWDNMIEETTPTSLRDFFHNLTRFPPPVVRMLPRTSADHRSLPDTRPCLQWWCWQHLCLRTSLPSSPPAQTMSAVTACWVTWLSAEAHAESDRTRRPSNSINTEDTCKRRLLFPFLLKTYSTNSLLLFSEALLAFCFVGCLPTQSPFKI